MTQKTSPNSPLVLPIALLGGFVTILFLTSFFFLAPKIQNNLASEIQKKLKEQSIPAEITLSGRDVTLRGKVNDDDDLKKAETITKKVCGIRFVDNQLLTEKPENIAKLKSKHKSEKQDNSEIAQPLEKKEEQIAKTDQPSRLKSHAIEPENIEAKNIDVQSSSVQGTHQARTPDSANSHRTPASKDQEKDQKKVADKQKADNNEQQKIAGKSLTLTDKKESAGEIKKPLIIASNQTDTSKSKEKIKDDKHPATRKSTNNRNILNYDAMLAAMNAYNKEKGIINKKTETTTHQSNKSKSSYEKEINSSVIQVIFNSGDSRINEKSVHIIDQLSKKIKESNQAIKVTVTATDSTLALERAKSIREYMIKHAVAAKNIKISGKSGSNERVEILNLTEE